MKQFRPDTFRLFRYSYKNSCKKLFESAAFCVTIMTADSTASRLNRTAMPRNSIKAAVFSRFYGVAPLLQCVLQAAFQKPPVERSGFFCIRGKKPALEQSFRRCSVRTPIRQDAFRPGGRSEDGTHGGINRGKEYLT